MATYLRQSLAFLTALSLSLQASCRSQDQDGLSLSAPAAAATTNAAAAGASWEFPAIEVQHASRWCWAAAMQNVLAYNGVVVTQEDIVRKASGGFLVNETATPAFVARLLRTYDIPAQAMGRTLTDKELRAIFADGHKVIADVNPWGVPHAVVLQAINEDDDIVISDPYTGETYYDSRDGLHRRWLWLDAIIIG